MNIAIESSTMFDKIDNIQFLKLVREFHNPKGMCLNEKVPYEQVKVVFSSTSWDMEI